MNKNKMEVFKEIGLSVVFSLAYILLASRLSLYLLLLIPIPFIVTSARNNLAIGALAMFISFSVLGFIYSVSLGLSLLAIFLPITLILAYMFRKNASNKKAIIIGTVIFLASLVAILSLESTTTNIDFSQEMEKAFDSMLELQTEAFESLDMTNMEIKKGRDFLQTSYQYIMAVMPSIFIIVSMIVTYLNYKVSAYLLKRTGSNKIVIPDFSRFRLPENIITGSIVMFIAAYGINKLELPYHKALNMNLSFLLGFLFLVQGFSLIDYFLKRIGVRKFFRLMILVINFIVMPIGGILIILGFIDSLFDLRKLRKKS